MDSDETRIFLIDNGSLRPEATLVLRRLASELSVRFGRRVEPVSLLHSDKAPVSELGGCPACVLEPEMRRLARDEGVRRFILVPFFLGASRAITEYMPKVAARVSEEAGLDMDVRVADPLAGPDMESPDPRLIDALVDEARTAMQREAWQRPTVALVDHGTPEPSVNRLRQAVTAQLAARLGEDVEQVIAASMERRAGPEYDFNEPLLENLQAPDRVGGQNLIVALFFLLPGRHAGPGGDVVEICDGLKERNIFRRIVRTSLLCERPELPAILEDRILSVD
ncbi:MAG: sirohydrochlorin chelatase [Opitutales bacterium]